MGKVSYIRRFIPALSELIKPFHKLLKKNLSFQWKAEQQVTFQRVKDVLSSPQTTISPAKGIPLTRYLTSTEKSIAAFLAQKIEGAERLMYYHSRLLRGAEANYSMIEHHCLALVFATQKLRHYFLAHPINPITRSNPLSYLLSRPVMSRRTARWLL